MAATVARAPAGHRVGAGGYRHRRVPRRAGAGVTLGAAVPQQAKVEHHLDGDPDDRSGDPAGTQLGTVAFGDVGCDVA
ncbi:MAG TPA: hypothetical protein VIR27_07670, partial [Mycobacteriales bacterium]